MPISSRKQKLQKVNHNKNNVFRRHALDCSKAKILVTEQLTMSKRER